MPRFDPQNAKRRKERSAAVEFFYAAAILAFRADGVANLTLVIHEKRDTVAEFCRHWRRGPRRAALFEQFLHRDRPQGLADDLFEAPEQRSLRVAVHETGNPFERFDELARLQSGGPRWIDP